VLLNERLFSLAAIPIGCEHSLQTGPAACGLSVDAERARYLRRGSQEMWGSEDAWEPQTPQEDVPLSEAWIQLPGEKDAPGRWVAAEANAAFMQKFAKGPLCRLPGEKKRYGRELHLGMRRGDGTLQLAPKLRDALATKLVSAEDIGPQVLAKLPGITGGTLSALSPRGDQLFAQISYGALPQKAHRDAAGKALIAPPQRRIVPPACEGCPQRPWCETVSIENSAAMAWRTLGLIEEDGTPTRRGILFSFFQHGEGLAIAAALEDKNYPVTDLVFDIADLRGGPRFAAEDAHATGRLAMVCQRTFRSADYEGYLRFGVPADYGAGASEAVRGIVQHGLPRQQLIGEMLRMGDIERALLEWRSLLRHVAHAPAHDWPRWEALQTAARTTLAQLTPA
jgi:hypothetical protein